jgi:predicted dehydrogenase
MHFDLSLMKRLPTVLVIGCGSIGERHVRTFLRTGRCQVIACDKSRERLDAISQLYGIQTFQTWQDAFAKNEIYACVVATPADSHVRLAIESLRLGCHCLIEKPLAIDPTGIKFLVEAHRRSGCAVAVAYVHRCRPAFIAASDFLRKGELGRVHQAFAISGQDFAFLRPAYQEVYYRDHATGGGAIQDALTHLVNCVECLIGPTESVYCDADHLSLPGVEVEDTVAAIARNGSTIVSYSLNQFQAPNETSLQLNAELGSIRIEFGSNRWGVLAKGAGDWSWTVHPVHGADALFVAQANGFLDQCEGNGSALASLEEGIQAVAFNVAAFESWEKKSVVQIHPAHPTFSLPISPTNYTFDQTQPLKGGLPAKIDLGNPDCP